MGKKYKKKDKFSKLSSEFKDAVLQSSTDEIRKRISQVAILDVEMRKLLKADPKVLDARAVLKNVMQPYNEDLRSFKLQIEFANQALNDKGGGATVQPKAETEAAKQ